MSGGRARGWTGLSLDKLEGGPNIILAMKHNKTLCNYRLQGSELCGLYMIGNICYGTVWGQYYADHDA